MKNFFCLKIIDLFKWIYLSFGVDYKKMRLILQSKLLLDTRRSSNLFDNSFNSNSDEQFSDKKEKNYFRSSLIAYFIVGCICSLIVVGDLDPVIKMSIYFSIFMVMILTILISDFSTVILDVNDKDIIGTKGVDAKTLNAAKITHVFIYITVLSLSLSFVPILVSYKFGIWYMLLFITNILLIDIFMIIVTATMYLILLKMFNGEKLKDIINTFQILFVLLFTIGYQFVGRSFDIVDINITYTPNMWNIFLPPMWFASSFSFLRDGENIDIVVRILRMIAIVVPIISIIIYTKMIPIFERNLQKLNDNTYISNRKNESFYFKVSKVICKKKEERIFFNFVNDILKKDREFKTKIYPTLAMAAFMPVLTIYSLNRNLEINNFFNQGINTPLVLSIYLTSAISQTIVVMMKYSKEYEASWMYDVLPIRNKGYIYSAMVKAGIFKLVLPVFLVNAFMFLLISGVYSLLNVGVIFVASILASMITFSINEKNMPFSKPYLSAEASAGFMIMLKSVLIIGILAGIHYVVLDSLLLTLLYALAMLIIIVLSWKKVFKINRKI